MAGAFHGTVVCVRLPLLCQRVTDLSQALLFQGSLQVVSALPPANLLCPVHVHVGDSMSMLCTSSDSQQCVQRLLWPC